jgi:hypothetical protein
MEKKMHYKKRDKEKEINRENVRGKDARNVKPIASRYCEAMTAASILYDASSFDPDNYVPTAFKCNRD